MEYNSNRKKLILPEYGRNVQKMVDFALTVEDREERNRVARTIIAIMGNMYPHLRDVTDFRHKLWDHLAIMSEFKLEIDSPYELPTLEKLNEKPEMLPYSNQEIAYRHYGKTIEAMVAKATEMEESQEKKALMKLIATYMKKSFLTWNKDSVSDEKIFTDFKTLSKGKIKIPEDFKLQDNYNHDRDFAHRKKRGSHKNGHRKYKNK